MAGSCDPQRTDLTAERLRSRLDYDPETGVFTWRERSDIARASRCASWNSRYARTVAGAIVRNGNYTYRRIVLDARPYRAHRLAWLHVFGEWPPDGFEIDHIDCDATNNRLVNLRLATSSQNKGNARRRIDNTTGAKGVHFDRRRGQFKAEIKCDGRRKFLGYRATREESAADYALAAQRHFGEFARTA